MENGIGSGPWSPCSARPPWPPRPGPASPEADDRARGAAERFLFERLESLAATSGLFELHEALDVPFGPGRAMGVDLVCRPLGLAIEVDGPGRVVAVDLRPRPADPGRPLDPSITSGPGGLRNSRPLGKPPLGAILGPDAFSKTG